MAFKPIEILINAKDNASSVFTSLQAKVVAVGTAIAAYFGISAFAGVVRGAADFEQAMSRVRAATGASADEMSRLRKAAEDAGASTQFTSVEAAGALENLAKAGLNANDAIAALPAVLKLASAGGVELGQASEFITKVVMGLGLAFEDASRVADVLAMAANATNTSVTGLAQALSYAAPVANSLGLSLESTVAIIGKFADAGIDASRAGTALNSILSQFADPASKFRNELAAAGIVTGNFDDALRQLAAAGPLGSKAINAVGLEAGPALRALLNQGVGALDELTAKLKSAEGSAAATAKVMQDNLNGSLTGLASAWNTVKNVLGTPVLPVIKDGVDQLSAALKKAVADGTVAKFGEAIATAFQAGIKWVREFLGAVDFARLTADLQSFAARTGEVFTQVGQYAINAGNIVKVAYGVMSAGFNAVLAVIYKVGEAFAFQASAIQTGLAAIMDGFAKVTFGKLSASFKAAADEVRLSAEATMASSQALGQKSAEAFQQAADSAQLARDGYNGLEGAVSTTSAATQAWAQTVAAANAEIAKTADAATAAASAVEKKAQADLTAKQSADEHRAAVALLRAEYQELVAKGDLQAAAAKLQEINRALQETGASAKDAARAAADAAAQIEAAFGRLGVTSAAELKRQADAAQRDYATIKNAGTSTAEDIANAFKIAAEKAIAANKGIAPTWVEAEAATRGYEVQIDSAGKATLKLRDAVDAVGATSGRVAPAMQGHWGGVASAINTTSKALQDYQRRMQQTYGRPGEGDKGLFERGRFSSNGQELGAGVQEVGSGGAQYRNRDGFTSDALGRAQTQGIWTRAAIIDYLTQSGLDEQIARKLSEQFVDANGNVPYAANDVQKRWAGRYGTLSEALGKMADYFQNTDQGQLEAQRILDFEKVRRSTPQAEGNGAGAPATAGAPARTTGTSVGAAPAGQSNSIVINVHGVTDPAKLARMLEPELKRMAALAR